MDEQHHQQLSVEVDYLMDRLAPLADGKPVALQLITPKATGRRKDPIITITPGALMGFPKSVMVVAVLNIGSCMIDLDTKVKRRTDPKPLPKISPLVLAGISAKLAVTLVTKLQALMGYSKEKRNGNRSTHRPRTNPHRRARRPRCTPYRDC